MPKVFELQESAETACLWYDDKTDQWISGNLSKFEMWCRQKTLILFVNDRAALQRHIFKKLHQLSEGEKCFLIYLVGNSFTAFAMFCALEML